MKRVQLANHSTGLCLHFWQVFLMMHDDWFGSGRPELREAVSYGAPHEHLKKRECILFYIAQTYWQCKYPFSSMPEKHTKIEIELNKEEREQQRKSRLLLIITNKHI